MVSFLINYINLPLLFLLFVSSSIIANCIVQSSHPRAWHRFEKLINTSKGSHVEEITELKRYFHRFGYFYHPQHQFLNHTKVNFTNKFDDHLEKIIIRYQKNYGLPVTGTLNPSTVSMIMSPRCGMPDHYMRKNNVFKRSSSLLHGTQHYLYFPGQPRWNREIPITLTYKFSVDEIVPYLTLHEIKGAFERAFTKWSKVIPVKFTEARAYDFPDIKIGFYKGDHGDGEPFDGVLGVLAHAFSPENGRFHLDGAERWSVDLDKDGSDVAIDLESVALHEIGHLLGLAHSNVKESVMYPSLKPREQKLNLKFDDIRGVQYLYGSNPNFTMGALLESETSSSQSIIFWVGFRISVSFLLISITFLFHL